MHANCEPGLHVLQCGQQLLEHHGRDLVHDMRACDFVRGRDLRGLRVHADRGPGLRVLRRGNQLHEHHGRGRLHDVRACVLVRRRQLRGFRVQRHEQHRMRSLRRRLLFGCPRRDLVQPVPYGTGLRNRHAHGPDELRLQLAGLRLERNGAGVRCRTRVRQWQHVVGHGLRAVLYLR